MAELLLRGDTDLVVENDGAGRLYYRLGLRYAPDDLVLDPLDRGFRRRASLRSRRRPRRRRPRRRRRVAHPGRRHGAGDPVDGRRQPPHQHRPGRSAARRVRDPVDGAGDDPRGPTAARRGRTSSRATSPSRRPPGEPTSRRSGGARGGITRTAATTAPRPSPASCPPATTPTATWPGRRHPGTFVVPPTKAEEIYTPETFGRSASATVIIE